MSVGQACFSLIVLLLLLHPLLGCHYGCDDNGLLYVVENSNISNNRVVVVTMDMDEAVVRTWLIRR